MRGAFSDFIEKRFRDPGELAHAECAENQFGKIRQQLPDLDRQIATWAALIVELLFLPLSFCLTTRKVACLAMIGLQIAILCLVNFADLTIAMLLVHLFTFDPRWVWPTADRRSFQAEAGSVIAGKAEAA